MRKQLDPRIPTLIRNNVSLGHRSFFVLVGDRGRDQVVNLHFLLSQSRVEARPNVLWCYKKDLGFTTHRKKREAKIKRDIKRGIREKGEGDPFELFVGVTDIRYCYYKDTPRVLGQTFGMLILQDFEALTPNLLARTIETVEGGGIVVLLLRTMTSLRQLYSAGMDVHAKYRTSSSQDDPVARFNERFLLSLGACPDCLVLDDELNVLPLSAGKEVRPLPETQSTAIGGESEGGAAVGKGKARGANERELAKLREDVRETKVVGEVVKHAKTLDQARAVLTILDILASASLSTTVTLTAARGRGKSAALGLSIAAAIAHGYSNIFVTSPSPENLKTLFEFVFKGLDALGYEEVADWDLQRGTGEWKDVVVRVNVFRGHRQTIQYIQPTDAHVLGQAELVVIDEAAAIPLPLVRNLLGPYLVFLSSTINGYEGTGRSLSLKLIQQLRESTRGITKIEDDSAASSSKGASGKGGAKSGPGSGRAGGAALAARSLREVDLKEPIRYSAGDTIEAWLHQLLCLDASLTRLPSGSSGAAKGCPHPSACELYMVNRDALFSFHPASEVFLQRMMALYVASHYKNSPNDLQLMSDAPGHRLFVLLAPLAPGDTSLPEPLCVVQVALEGNISRQAILNSLGRGTREAGDLIPWLVAQQYQDADFAMLSGARVVRIAVHPDYAHMGYGTRALQALEAFYSNELLDADAVRDDADEGETFVSARDKPTARSGADNLQHETVAVRDAAKMPALLQRLSERRPEALDYLGVSYGLTPQLLKFWKRAGYTPLYLRQTANELTGEYTTVMLRALEGGAAAGARGGAAWLGAFAADFRRRFISLLSYRFREFGTITSLSVLEAASAGVRAAGGEGTPPPLAAAEVRTLLTPFDMKRLESYGNNMLDYHVILDLLPTLAALYFNRRLRSADEDGGDAAAIVEDESAEQEQQRPELKLSGVQSAILLSVGLQRKSIDDACAELGLPAPQALALFVKAIRRIARSLRAVERADIARQMVDAGAEGPKRKWGPGQISGEGAGQITEVGEGAARKDWQPMDKSVDDELKEAGSMAAEEREKRQRQRELIDSMDLGKYAIDESRDWSAAEAHVAALEGATSSDGGRKLSTIISVSGSGEAPKEVAVTPKGTPTAKGGKRKESTPGKDRNGKKARR